MPKGNPGEPKRRYTGEFKQKVVEQMRAKGMGYRETGRAFGVRHEVVRTWERTYLKYGAEGLYEERRGKANALTSAKIGKPPINNKQHEEDLIAENQRLRMEIDYLKKLNALVLERKRQERKRK